MTSWEVERDERTACRSVIAHGATTLMPSHSHGAERRPERRASRTGSRWALRALVVGGLAGAAWLLTGAAAHAADHDSGPLGSVLGSTLDSVATVSGNEPPVGELLKAAIQPLESAPKSHRRPTSGFPRGSSAVTSILTAPERVLSGPVETLDEVVHDGSVIGVETVDKVLRTATAPPRASGEKADDRTWTGSVDTATDPVTEPEPAEPASAEEPVTVTAAVQDGAADVVDGARTVVRTKPLAEASASTQASRADAGITPVRYTEAQSRSHVHRHVAAARPATPETIREDRPVDDGPAPMRMNLGAVSGIPAGGSGASPEVGSAAVLPARVANGAVHNQVRPLAADVEVRRHDAEAPTVSPD
ncbi:hypothetical protein OHA21_39655 [Actinoplanes sp. NBC_00393]|uniref:hypothetical protein n=1 Tax=Actinoplanes sp. NBC_00393 TaxID=2975953 RepID=UPI002E241BE2